MYEFVSGRWSDSRVKVIKSKKKIWEELEFKFVNKNHNKCLQLLKIY